MIMVVHHRAVHTLTNRPVVLRIVHLWNHSIVVSEADQIGRLGIVDQKNRRLAVAMIEVIIIPTIDIRDAIGIITIVQRAIANRVPDGQRVIIRSMREDVMGIRIPIGRPGTKDLGQMDVDWIGDTAQNEVVEEVRKEETEVIDQTGTMPNET